MKRLTVAVAIVGALASRIARGVKGRAGIDAEAATLLLQSYVDTKRGGSGWDPDDA